MATFCFCYTLIILSIMIICHCQVAVITVPPVSVTVPPFTTATFTCEGNGDILNWWIKSAPLTDSIKQQREISVTTTNTSNTNFSSVLTVNAIPDNDELGIGCEVITFSPFNRVISNSELTIRGMSPVEDIQRSFPTNTTLLITWSPPVYYSNDVPAGSPLTYQVLVTEYDEEDTIFFNDIIPATSIEVNDVSECDTFNISVTAILAQYTSINNTISNNGSFGYSATITTNKNNSQSPNVSIALSCPPSKCNSSLTITSGSKVINQYKINGSDNVFNYNTHTLVPSNEYNCTVYIYNLREKLEYETYISITIYKVIGLYITNTYTNGSVSVQCVYEELTTTDGCHVIFTDTSNGRNESFNITGSGNSALVTLSTNGVYTVTAYDIVNGSLYGPAVYYPTPVEIIEVIPSTSTSFSNTRQNTTSLQFTIDVSPTTTTTVTIETATASSTSETIDDTKHYIVPVVAGVLGGIVLVILIILAVCVGISFCKRKMTKAKVLLRSENATIHQPQAETNSYQYVQELINEVAINARSPVMVTGSRPINEENPYHVTRSEFLTVNHPILSHNLEDQLMQQQPRPSLTSMTTQETTLEDSISSTTSNNIHDNQYTTDPTNATDTINVTVNDTNTTVRDNEATNNTATANNNEATNNTAAAIAPVNDTAATVTPTYAVIGKRTDTTVPPVIDQHVTYDTVTGDINKRGGCITVYPSDDISAIPPPPSYADTIAQECDDCAAVVHGQYEKHPPTYTGDEYGSKTPVQDQANCTDAEAVQEWLDVPVNSHKDNSDGRIGGPTMEEESPINDYLIQFRETPENMSFEKPLLDDSSFISDEMVGVNSCLVVLSSSKEMGTLVTGFTSKTEVLTTTIHQVNATTNEYQTQRVFEDNSDWENHEVPEVVPSIHDKGNCIFRYFFKLC